MDDELGSAQRQQVPVDVLRELLETAAARQVLTRLAEGEGADTAEGRTWLKVESLVRTAEQLHPPAPKWGSAMSTESADTLPCPVCAARQHGGCAGESDKGPPAVAASTSAAGAKGHLRAEPLRSFWIGRVLIQSAWSKEGAWTVTKGREQYSFWLYFGPLSHPEGRAWLLTIWRWKLAIACA